MDKQKVKSGIPGLDSLLGGGFSRKNVVVVAGDTGSGRTIFCSQFLAAGAVDFGEPGLFLSFDSQKDTIYSNLISFGWDLKELENEQKVVFIDYPQNELASISEQEGALRDLINTIGIKRVVIDSITPFALLFSNPEERKLNTFKLVNIVRGWKTTTLITAETISSSQSEVPRTISGIESFADGLIHLSYVLKKGKRERMIEIVKMRGACHQHEIVPAKISSHGFLVGEAAIRKAAEKTVGSDD